MTSKLLAAILMTLSLFSIASRANAAGPTFKKVMVLVFENEDDQKVMKFPFFAQLAKDGATLNKFYGEVHPSQGNYIAMTAGDAYGVYSDSNIDLNVRHIGDLLEAKGKSWKAYAEGYPGGCFTAKNKGDYVRKHLPFLSYLNVTKDAARCAQHVVSSAEFDKDVAAGTLPDYSMYVPDLKNDGHDTGVAFADKWFANRFGPLLKDRRFMQDMLLVATFDESTYTGGNHIYTVLYGAGVKAGTSIDTRHDHYSILRMIEDAFGLGNLGRNDAKAPAITGIWQ